VRGQGAAKASRFSGVPQLTRISGFCGPRQTACAQRHRAPQRPSSTALAKLRQHRRVRLRRKFAAEGKGTSARCQCDSASHGRVRLDNLGLEYAPASCLSAAQRRAPIGAARFIPSGSHLAKAVIRSGVSRWIARRAPANACALEKVRMPDQAADIGRPRSGRPIGGAIDIAHRRSHSSRGILGAKPY